MGSDMSIEAQGNPYNLGTVRGGDPNHLFVTPGIAEQRHNVFVCHLDSLALAFNNLGVAAVARHLSEKSQIAVELDPGGTMVRVGHLTFVILLLGLADQAAAQRPGFAPNTKPPAEEPSAVAVTASVGDKSFRGDGRGECRHSPDATIRGVSAAFWTVAFSGGRGSLKQLKLTLRRPKDGSPDNVSLEFATASGSHHIRTGGAGENSGEASVAVLPSGPGGRVEIKGKDAEGKPVQIAIDCPAFSPAVTDSQ